MPSSKPAEAEIRRIAREVKAVARCFKVDVDQVIDVARRHFAEIETTATPKTRKCHEKRDA